MCVQQSEREREKEEANPDHDSTLLSTSATRRSRDRSLTRTVEVLDQRAIQDVPGRNPTPLLRTVPLPVHQKLVTTPTRAHVKELMDSVNRSLLVNRRRGKGGAGQSAENRFDAGHVKNRMNTAQLTGQSEFDRDRTENLNNRKEAQRSGASACENPPGWGDCGWKATPSDHKHTWGTGPGDDWRLNVCVF